MVHRFMGERTLMRIFLGEADRCEAEPYKGRPLYEAILLTLRDRGFAGATVLRGVAGFGASTHLHTDRVLRLSHDLPVVVEVVEREEAIQDVIPELDQMIDGGLITLERARVILYRPARPVDEDRWRLRAQGLEPEADERDRAGEDVHSEFKPESSS
jgi:PII-like signaling protein